MAYFDLKRPINSSAKLALILISLLLTLLPIVRFSVYLFTHGSENPCSDDIMVMVFLSKFSNETYNWKNIFQDTFQANGQLPLIPLLFQIILSKVTHLNVLLNLQIGLLLCCISLVLVHSILSKNLNFLLKVILWPTLSFLMFSPSQLSNFEFNIATFQTNFHQLGFFLGLWGLLRFPNKRAGIILILLGGLLASWSWSGGVCVWPVFLIGMILLGFKRLYHYICFLIIALIACSPYLYFLFLDPNRTPTVENIIRPHFNILIQSIGWSLSQNFITKVALVRGWAGLFFLLSGVLLIFFKFYKFKKQFYPGFLIILFSLLIIFQISLFRIGLAPWYTTFFILVWIGLVGWGFTFLHLTQNEAHKITILWPCLFLGFLGYFYLTSNISYEDKSFFLRCRSPASASCLRNFTDAPTYCENTLLLWEPGMYSLLIPYMGKPLYNNKLSVFSPKQRWTLQGDFILPSVTTKEMPGTPLIAWFSGTDVQPISFLDPRHLKVLIYPPNQIEWKIKIPSEIKNAAFYSAAMISTSSNNDPLADGAIFQVWLTSDQEPPKIMASNYLPPEWHKWQAIYFSLQPYAGKEITIRLTAIPLNNSSQDWVIFRDPHIDLKLNSENSSNDFSEIRPSNTDLSSFFPSRTTEDFIFDLKNESLWEKEGPISDQAVTYDSIQFKTEGAFSIKFKGELNLCLKDYSHIIFRESVSQNIFPRAAKIELITDTPSELNKSIFVPLLMDDQQHSYSFDLKTLRIDSNTRIKGFKIFPIATEEKFSDGKVEIWDLVMIRNGNPSFCNN